MSTYRTNALRPRPRAAVARAAIIGLAIAAAAAVVTAVASAVASAVELQASSELRSLFTPAWSGAAIAANLLLCVGLMVVGVGAATLWLLASASQWASPSHVTSPLRDACFFAGGGAITSDGSAVCAVPMVWQRPYARSALPAVAAGALGVVTLAAYWGQGVSYGPGTALSFAALAFAFVAAVRGLRAPTIAEAAMCVRLDGADRAHDAATYDAFVSGRLRDAIYAVVACTTALALETASLGLVPTGMAGAALTSLAVLVTLQRVRRYATPPTSIVPVLAAALAFAVALFGLMLALPPPVAARRSEARWLRFMIGALALTMLGSAMLGLVSAPQHGWYVRAPRTILMSVFDGAALAISFIAARDARDFPAEQLGARRVQRATLST